MLNDLYQIIVHLNTLTDSLRKFLQKEVYLDCTGTCNEIYIETKVNNTFSKKKKIDKDDHKTAYCSSRSLSQTYPWCCQTKREYFSIVWQTITHKRICIIQQPQSFCKSLEQPKIEISITNRIARLYNARCCTRL